MFQIRYDRSWHFFETVFYIIIGIFGGLYGAFVIKWNLRAQAFRKKYLSKYAILEATLLAAWTAIICYPNMFLRIDMTESMEILFLECEGAEIARLSPPHYFSMQHSGTTYNTTKAETDRLWQRIVARSTPSLLDIVKQNLCFIDLHINERNVKDQADTRAAFTTHETIVCEAMMDADGVLSNAILAHFIDLCSSLSLHALDLPTEGFTPSKSTELRIAFHRSPSVGTPLRLISSVISADKRVQSVHCEVLDTSKPKHELVATATHLKLQTPGPASGGDDEWQAWQDCAFADREPSALAKL